MESTSTGFIPENPEAYIIGKDIEKRIIPIEMDSGYFTYHIAKKELIQFLRESGCLVTRVHNGAQPATGRDQEAETSFAASFTVYISGMEEEGFQLPLVSGLSAKVKSLKRKVNDEIKKIWKTGVYAYLYPKGYVLSGDMLLHSLEDNPEPWIKDSASREAEMIKGTRQYQKILNEIKSDIEKGKLQNVKSIEFIDEDLFRSIKRADVYYETISEKYSFFDVEIVIKDIYNYDFNLMDYMADGFLITANNFAALSEYFDIIKPYPVEIHLTERLTREKDRK